MELPQHALLTLVFFSLLVFTASAQVPKAFRYQAVVRNTAGEVLANQSVALKINLLQNDTVYTETHTATTNAFGLVNLQVGRGAASFGQFANINWGIRTLIRISLDATGGTNYQFMGTSELLSVPYALYAADGNGLPSVQWGGQGTNILSLPGITTTTASLMDFNGQTNTSFIRNQLGTNNGISYAARVCADLIAYGFDDWYLPAAGELHEMYLQLGPVANGGSGQIPTGVY